MKNYISTLALLVGMSAANAGDLPSGKAQPTSAADYVKVCSAYGSGYFTLPGSDTCIKLGSLVRFETQYAPTGNLYKVTSGAKAIATTGAGEASSGTTTTGIVSFESRTPTELGDIRTVADVKIVRVSGNASEASQPSGATQSASTTSTGSTENAYIQYLGFTGGIAGDNFKYMSRPGHYLGTPHWSGFSNGVTQMSYTALFGGGLSGTLALQNPSDTTIAPIDATAPSAPTIYNTAKLPQVVGRLQLDQSWGRAAVMGAFAQQTAANALGTYSASYNTWAAGSGVTLNLPMLAQGDNISFTANYANGMTEYTVVSGSNKKPQWTRELNGWVTNPPSALFYANNDVGLVKSWNIGADLQHWWSPKWSSDLMVSYGAWTAPAKSAALVWTGKEAFGSGNVGSVSANLMWKPVKDFQIGAEVGYSRITQDVRYTLASATNVVKSEKDGNWTVRTMVERKF